MIAWVSGVLLRCSPEGPDGSPSTEDDGDVYEVSSGLCLRIFGRSWMSKRQNEEVDDDNDAAAGGGGNVDVIVVVIDIVDDIIYDDDDDDDDYNVGGVLTLRLDLCPIDLYTTYHPAEQLLGVLET